MSNRTAIKGSLLLNPLTLLVGLAADTMLRDLKDDEGLAIDVACALEMVDEVLLMHNVSDDDRRLAAVEAKIQVMGMNGNGQEWTGQKGYDLLVAVYKIVAAPGYRRMY